MTYTDKLTYYDLENACDRAKKTAKAINKEIFKPIVNLLESYKKDFEVLCSAVAEGVDVFDIDSWFHSYDSEVERIKPTFINIPEIEDKRVSRLVEKENDEKLKHLGPYAQGFRRICSVIADNTFDKKESLIDEFFSYQYGEESRSALEQLDIRDIIRLIQMHTFGEGFEHREEILVIFPIMFRILSSELASEDKKDFLEGCVKAFDDAKVTGHETYGNYINYFESPILQEVATMSSFATEETKESVDDTITQMMIDYSKTNRKVKQK